MDLWLVGVAEVPHHKDIAFVTVAAGVPLLVDGDTIDTLDGGVRHDGDVVEVHLDIARVLEGALEVLQILVLGLRAIDDLVARGHHLGLLGLDDAADDDEGILGEHLAQELQVLLVVGGSEMLHVVENHHAVLQVGHLVALVARLVHTQTGVELGIDGVVEADDDTLAVEVDDGLLVAQLLAVAGSLHDEGNATHLIAGTGGEQTLNDLFLDTLEALVGPQLVELALSVLHHVVLWKLQLRLAALVGAVDERHHRRHGVLHLLLERLVVNAIVDDQAHLVVGDD